MSGYKPGDRVWVKNPNLPVERKVGTVMQVRKTAKGVRYVVEWEVDLVENGHEQTHYLAEEIASANNGGTAAPTRV